MPEGSGRVEAVALDAMGVIYPVADDLRDLLIPFLRSKGSTVTDEAIIDAFRACYRNGAPASSIWQCAGLDAGNTAIEDEYLACYELSPGVREFLEAMREAAVPIYGLSNDVGEWARKRLPRLGLDGLFSGWVFSSEVRSPKPQPAIYGKLVEMLPCPPETCVFVDDRIANLEAARDAGLQTVLFGAMSDEKHDAVQDFAALHSLLAGSRL